MSDFDLSKVKQSRSRSSVRNASSIAKGYARRIEEEEERKRNQQLIDQEYQRTLAENQKRGALDRVADGLSILQYPVFGAVVEGADGWEQGDNLIEKTAGAVGGVFKGAWEGFKGANPFLDDYTKGEYRFENVLNELSGDSWKNTNGHIQSGSDVINAFKTGDIKGGLTGFTKGAVEFAGDVVLDPINLVGGSAIKTVAKGTGKRLGRETIEALSKEAIQDVGRKQGLTIASETAEKYAKKANKIRGVVDTSEKLTFAGKELGKTTDFLRAVGDKSIAPIVNTTGDFIKSTKPVEFFDTLYETRKLAKTDIDGFVKQMAWKDSGIEKALKRVGFNSEMIQRTNSMFKNVSADERKKIVDVMESGKMIIDVTKDAPTDFHRELFKDFIDMRMANMKNVEGEELVVGYANKKMREVFNGTIDPFERMAVPKTKPEETVFRNFLDPKGQMKDKPYEVVYKQFMDNMTVTTKRFDENPIPPKNMVEAIVSKTQRTPINEMQRKSGIFINNNNLEKYSVLFKQPKSLSAVVNMNPKKKLEYLNNILFDGKPVIAVDLTTKGADGKLNSIINLIKQNPSEGELLRNLEGMVSGNTGSYLDIFIDDATLVQSIKSTGVVPNDIMEQIVDNTGKQIRLYDSETRNLIADNLSGTFANRTDTVADGMRIRKEARLSAIKEAVPRIEKGETIGEIGVSELLGRQKQQILTQLEAMLPNDMKYLIGDERTLSEIASRTEADILTIAREQMEKQGKTLADFDYNEMRYGRYLNRIYNDELQKHTMAQLYNTIKTEGIQSPQVIHDVMKLDVLLPPSYQDGLKGVYEYTYTNKNTGETLQYTYDPYTRQIGGRPVSIIESVVEEAGKTVKDQADVINDVLQVSMTDRVLTDQFASFIDMQEMKDGSKFIVESGELFIQRTERRLDLDNVDLSHDAKEAIKFITERLQDFAFTEKGSRKLQTQLTQYVPHILNPELRNNPAIMEKLKKQNPELYRQVLMYSGDKFNKHALERSSALETAVQEILGKRYAQEGLEYAGKGKTIAEVNEALKPMLESAGFDGDFFINDIYEAFIHRAINHGEVVYAEGFVDDTVKQFAKWVDTSTIRDKGKYYITQKDLRACFKDNADGSVLAEERQWTLLQEMGFDPKKRYNKMLIEVDGKQLKSMREAVKKRNPDINLGGYEVPKYVVQNLNKIGHVQQLEDMNLALKCIDKFTNLWKQTATVINPGFHLRNYASNSFQNYLAVGTDVINKDVRNMVKEIISGKEGMLVTKNGQQIPYKVIRDQLQARDILSRIDFDVTKQSNQTGKLFGDELNRGNGGLLQAGLDAIKEPFGIQDTTVFNKIDPTDTQNFIPFNVGRKYGQKIEDFDRSLNFIANVRNDLGFDEASEMVDKFLFDYSDLTSFEMNIMKRVFPFYTWLRKNAPLQMEMLLEQPGKYTWAFRATNNSQEEGDTTHLPEFMSDWVRLPIEFNNKDMYINPSLPYQDITNIMSFGKKDAIGMLNPLAKIPLELGTNHNSFFDAPIITSTEPEKAWEQAGNYLGNSLFGGWNTLANTVGGVASGDIEKAIEKAGSVATGVRTKFYDPEKTRTDAIYRAIRSMEEKYKEPTNRVKAFNQDFEEYKQTKLKKYGY